VEGIVLSATAVSFVLGLVLAVLLVPIGQAIGFWLFFKWLDWKDRRHDA
jgi:hypothetical protein